MAADTVVGFTTGATNGDQIDIDISNLNTANLLTNGETDTIAFFGTAGAAITDATAGATNAIATISNDSAVHATVANATLILLDGGQQLLQMLVQLLTPLKHQVHSLLPTNQTLQTTIHSCSIRELQHGVRAYCCCIF